MRGTIRGLMGVVFLVTPWATGQEKGPATEAGLPIIHAQDAGKYVGQRAIVECKITVTRNTGRACFLNADAQRSFVVFLRQKDYSKFPEPPEKMYLDKYIQVRGLVKMYQGHPEIEVSDPSQIKILEGPSGKAAAAALERTFDGLLRVGAFNVLNLFDGHDDPYTRDESTPAKPKQQLELMAETIRTLDADVLVLEEVENRGYLEQVNRTRLGDLGYGKVVLFEGNDGRGIDCAVLSRLPVGPVTSHRHLRFKDGEGREARFQRDFLGVRIEPAGFKAFYVFPVHFKSKRGGPESTEPTRLAECRAARRILDDLLKREPEALVLVCGDFNDTLESASIKALLGTGSGRFVDFVKDLPKGMRSYNAGEHAEIIDFIFASPAMAKRYVSGSYAIYPGTVETLGSDHNPVLAQFDLRN